MQISIGGLEKLKKVTVCTGCFDTEDRALRHLTLVRDIFVRSGFSGEMHFISSVIRTESALDYIAESLAPFHLTLSIECFTERAKVLRPSKAIIDLNTFEAVCDGARERGIEVNFTYVAGIDRYDDMIGGFERFFPRITQFPLINGFQPHTSEMQHLLAPGANRLDFYLKARKDIERLFKPTSLRPQSWECYRPFWFYSFGDERMGGPRI